MTSTEETISFAADELIGEAIAQTGFDDFGALPFEEGLGVLLQTYDTHLLDPAGRQRCRSRVVSQLATRLRCEEAFKQIPQYRDEVITAPLFVTGLPRSGTSALLNLLAAAPENRALLQWEIQFPDPWPGSGPGDEDPRYRYLADALSSPENAAFQKIHYVDADTPEECVMLHAFAFSGVQLGFEIMLEPYRSWLLAQDLEPLYAYQLKQLQMMNWRRPGQRWLLKAPAHMLGIDAIMKVFPDARFIWCHRSPQQVVPSINSMNRAVMGMYAGDCRHLDAHKLGRDVMDWYATTLERGLAQRAGLPSGIFLDCSQQEFVDRPLELAQRIYREFDLPFTDETRAALLSHIEANPKGKHGKHEYDLASFGLSEELIDKRFDFYSRDKRWPLSD
jgi:Sulfotransferase family